MLKNYALKAQNVLKITWNGLKPVLRIWNDLFRIQLRIYRVPNPDPTQFIWAYLEIVLKKLHN